MPRKMLNAQNWSKLKTTLRNLGIYLKQNFIEAILYRIRTDCRRRNLPADFGIQYSNIY